MTKKIAELDAEHKNATAYFAAGSGSYKGYSQERWNATHKDAIARVNGSLPTGAGGNYIPPDYHRTYDGSVGEQRDPDGGYLYSGIPGVDGGQVTDQFPKGKKRTRRARRLNRGRK